MSKQEQIRCCRYLEKRLRVPSPFTKSVILDYYDGAVSGVTKCAICSDAFRFEMLEWDKRQNFRAFELRSLHPKLVASLVRLLTKVEPPRWPQWVPIIKLPVTEANQLNEKIKKILAGAEKKKGYIVISTDLAKEILVAKKITEEEITREGWIARLIKNSS